MVSGESPRDLANRLTSIFTILSEVTGRYYPVFEEGTSPKLECPYNGIYHTNPKTMRVYPHSNSAYCFSCGNYMTPVRLICEFKELSQDEAIEWIKEFTGYKPPSPEELWDQLTSSDVEIDTDALGEALKRYCEGKSPDWSVRQFDFDVSRPLSACLRLLRRVRSPEDAELWLSKSKQVMDVVLAD